MDPSEYPKAEREGSVVMSLALVASHRMKSTRMEAVLAVRLSSVVIRYPLLQSMHTTVSSCNRIFVPDVQSSFHILLEAVVSPGKYTSNSMHDVTFKLPYFTCGIMELSDSENSHN